jgi:signal transduction histidine kinase
MGDYIDNLCHELRTPLQIIYGISENALEYTNAKNENSLYYKNMTIINRNCEMLLDKLESYISATKNQYEYLQSINPSSSSLYKESQERCRGCYFFNKWIIDKERRQ